MPFNNIRRRALHYRLLFRSSQGPTWVLLQIKTAISLVFEFIGLVKLVRNWYAPLFVRFSPFAMQDAEVAIRTRAGLRYIIRPKRGELSILNEVLYHNIYARQLPISGTVVDIGAHIGIFAAYAGAKNNTVICYEPHYDNYALVLRNAHLNSLVNVIAFQQAVGDSRGTRQLSLHATKSYGHTLYPEDSYNHAEAMVVETVTLEDIFSSNSLRHVDMLKMHCEGAEYAILTRAPQTILERIDTIAIKHSGHNYTELGTFLSAAGFEVEYDDREMIYAIRKR